MNFGTANSLFVEKRRLLCFRTQLEIWIFAPIFELANLETFTFRTESLKHQKNARIWLNRSRNPWFMSKANTSMLMEY